MGRSRFALPRPWAAACLPPRSQTVARAHCTPPKSSRVLLAAPLAGIRPLSVRRLPAQSPVRPARAPARTACACWLGLQRPSRCGRNAALGSSRRAAAMAHRAAAAGEGVPAVPPRQSHQCSGHQRGAGNGSEPANGRGLAHCLRRITDATHIEVLKGPQIGSSEAPGRAGAKRSRRLFPVAKPQQLNAVGLPQAAELQAVAGAQRREHSERGRAHVFPSVEPSSAPVGSCLSSNAPGQNSGSQPRRPHHSPDRYLSSQA